ncbi:MAG: cytochrome C oxidase subunit IV family protein [Oleispira sp.]|nr:cytochrome C oxidase subunit IV family protein [Oleispira sp.]MBL4882338.1 cytochrome C oxidase subunit IV family protein [Oleispira sp.]
MTHSENPSISIDSNHSINKLSAILETEAPREPKPQKSSRHLDILWLCLMILTIINAAIAEQAEPSFLVTLIICSIIVLKARLVIDYFMELKGASPYIYHLMNAYFYVFPVLALFVWLYPEQLVELIQLVP